MRKVGVEPTRLAAVDFESTVSAIPPQSHVTLLGFEPRKGDPKSPVLPLHYRVVLPRGLEPRVTALKGRGFSRLIYGSKVLNCQCLQQGSNLRPIGYIPLRLSPPLRFVVWTLPSTVLVAPRQVSTPSLAGLARRCQ